MKFTLPKKNISPFYGDIKIPRKLKKKMKKLMYPHWQGLSNGQRLWHYLEFKSPKYKMFLMTTMCKND